MSIDLESHDFAKVLRNNQTRNEMSYQGTDTDEKAFTKVLDADKDKVHGGNNNRAQDPKLTFRESEELI